MSDPPPVPKPPGPTKPPSPAPQGLRAMFVVRSGPRRWPMGLRSALCMGVPVLVGWLAGDVTAGLTATLEGFTALYCNGRPYRNRAVLLAAIALSLSAAVGLGLWAASIVWVGVVTVAVIAILATLICNALDVGPPGAYQFALVCAVGTDLYGQHQTPGRVALLVLAGGAFAWLVHMSGALFRPYGPEKSAVASAAVAVAAYIDAVGTVRQDGARHRAAQAMHDAWTATFIRQPVHHVPNGAVRRLQEQVQQLNLAFAAAIASTHTAVDSSAAETARILSRQPFNAGGTGKSPSPGLLGLRSGAWALL